MDHHHQQKQARGARDGGRTIVPEKPIEGDVIADEPTLRAVAMMSTGPSLVQSPALSFGKAPPLGISRPSIGLKKAAPGSSAAFRVKKEWTAVASPSLWNVVGADLEPVPDFPLERTHREITDTDGSVVASRISKTLADLSIEAEFDCAKAKAKCKTSDCVGFRIRLYAGGEGGQPVVVEVQRRCGSASSFMRSCRAILNAAEGKSLSESTTRKVPPFMKKPVGELRCLQSTIKNEPRPGNPDGVLEGVVSMLRSRKHDSTVLALENLCCLTDPVKTTPSVALSVSKYISLGDERYDIREEIRVLTERDVYGMGAEVEDGLSRHMDQLRHLGLTVLANALSLTSKNGCLAEAVKEQKWFAEYLVPALCDEVRMASTNACNAHQAASCLHSLLSCSDCCRRLFLDNGGVQSLREAREFGSSRHHLLAEETGRCLKILELASTA